MAVIRKYADDRASAFAALLTHYAFLALFPLLVLLLTALDRFTASNPGLQDRIVGSVVAQLPIIGARLQQETAPLPVGGVMVVVSVASLLWGATGMYNSAQLAMSRVWNVQGVDRTGFVGRLWRSLVLFTILGIGVLAAAVAWWSGLVDLSTGVLRASTVAGMVILNGILLLIGLRIVTPPAVPTRQLIGPAIATGIAWEVLRFAGQWIVTRQLDQLNDLYGVFALVLVTLAWINLIARTGVLFVEAAVVWSHDLWPRRLAQPPLTAADRESLDRIVRNEHRRPEQHIDITWDQAASERPRSRDEPD